MGLGKADLEGFNLLSRAVLRMIEVEFDYRKPNAAKKEHRRVQPYHLANRENLWYLVGFDTERKALRTFALPRITDVAVTKNHFAKPGDFSPEKFFASALGVLGGDGDFLVIIRFKADVADRVREREWHESQEMRDLPDGGLELRMKLGALAEIERWVLGWGMAAEVLKPVALRERIKKTVGDMDSMYSVS